jgi:hypothetical protein
MFPGPRFFVLAQILGILAALQNSVPSNEAPKRPASLTLSNYHPSGCFPVAREKLASMPAALFISIVKVINQERTPFEVLVFLVPSGKKMHSPEQKILVGNFSLYPPDHPAGFLLSTSKALRELKSSSQFPNDGSLQLLVEIRRTDETKEWTPVELTVTAPEWRSEAHQESPQSRKP